MRTTGRISNPHEKGCNPPHVATLPLAPERKARVQKVPVYPQAVKQLISFGLTYRVTDESPKESVTGPSPETTPRQNSLLWCALRPEASNAATCEGVP